MFKVENTGDTGSVEISDILFTARGPKAGWVALEWNIKGDSKGSAAMWGESCVLLGEAVLNLLPRLSFQDWRRKGNRSPSR
jgi:glucan 1,3-beta-glucosidase